METGLATGLATLAATTREGKEGRAAILAGLAAALRPELVVWALAIAGGYALRTQHRASPHTPRLAVQAPLDPPYTRDYLRISRSAFAVYAGTRNPCSTSRRTTSVAPSRSTSSPTAASRSSNT